MRIDQNAVIPTFSTHDPHWAIELFVDAIRESRLIHYGSDFLINLGYTDLEALEEGIRRTHAICKTIKIPIIENIKPVFRDNNHQIYQDWKLSPLGCYLLMIYGHPNNPKVGEIQTEVNNSFSEIHKTIQAWKN